MSQQDGKGYVVPDPIDPGALQCFRVYVPAHTWYIGAFWAAYEQFTAWVAWARDPLHKGREAAAVWRRAFDLARAEYLAGMGCELNITNIRQNPINPCDLQASFDGGQNWVTVADLSKCAGGCGGGGEGVLRLGDGVIERFDPCAEDWVAAGPATEASEFARAGAYVGNPDGACLAAENAQGLIIKVSNDILDKFIAGFNTIDAVAAGAGWLAGFQPELLWMSILLELSAGFADYSEATLITWREYDPAPDLACALMTYFNADGSMSQSNFELALADIVAIKVSYGSGAEYGRWHMIEDIVRAQGRAGLVRANKAMGITVATVCDDCGWTHVLDFSTYAQGFTRFESLGGRWGLFTPGSGWETSYAQNSSGAYNNICIQGGWVSAHITTIEVIYNLEFGTQDPASRMQLFTYPFADGNSPIVTFGLIEGDDQTHTFALNADYAGIAIELAAGLDVGGVSDPSGYGLIKKIIVRGTGDNPFN